MRAMGGGYRPWRGMSMPVLGQWRVRFPCPDKRTTVIARRIEQLSELGSSEPEVFIICDENRRPSILGRLRLVRPVNGVCELCMWSETNGG